MFINTGKWLQNEIDTLIKEAAAIDNIGERISFLSGFFLEVDYDMATLSGSIDSPEELVVDLQGLDCFTFIDYVEAMRMSSSFDQFIENLKKVRYREGQVSFNGRNHFFTDWINNNSNYVADATEAVGGVFTQHSLKKINCKYDGRGFVDGIGTVEREVWYIPYDAVDDNVVSNLVTGDYAGIFTHIDGLDVTHVGIIIKENGEAVFRHASSVKGRVVDEGFAGYLSGKPGIVVLRPIGN